MTTVGPEALTVLPDGTTCSSGRDLSGPLGRDGADSASAVSVPMPEPVIHLAARTESTCALLRSGRVLCWGNNQSASLGVPVLMSSERPLLVTP